MKNLFTITMLTLLSFSVNAQIQVEEKPKATAPTQKTEAPFDSTRNTSHKTSFIGKELFFLDDGGDFFSDSLAENEIHPRPQLKYYVVLGQVYVHSREYFDERRMDFVSTKSRFLYKLKEKGTDNIIWYDSDLDNPLMPRDNAFTIYDVIWVSYYNYLKTEYIGKKFALTKNSFSDYNTGESVPYKYNDVWTIEDVKVIKDDGLGYRERYVLRLALKNNTGNVITLSPKSTLMVDKKAYDGYVKQYGAAMVKAAFEGELKVGMHKSLANYAIKQYLNADRDNLSISNTSTGEEWTIRSSSKTRYVSFNTAGKVKSWREEDTQSLRMTGKVSVSPR